MNKKEFALLELAFAAELDFTLPWELRFIQSKTKLAEKMVADGLFTKITRKWRGVTMQGYVLTFQGHYEYCQSYAALPDEE